MPIDDRTTNRSYKLPNAGNFLSDDVQRLRDALAAIDADVYDRYTKVEVDQLITDLIQGAPGALDTLNELAAALNDDANFAATVASQLALKADASNVYNKAESDARYVSNSQLTGMRNRIINSGMAIDQRNGGAAQTFIANASLAYSVDRWYGYCTGANVSGQRVQGASAGQYRYRFSGASGVTSIGFGQRIEQLNSADLAGTTATLSVDLANTLLTSVTWTAFYANTADVFTSRTQIATGTFTVNSTVARYITQISIPSAATTGLQIVFTVGAQTSGTWTIGDVQLEPGAIATPIERRSIGVELALCERYYEVGSYRSTYYYTSAWASAKYEYITFGTPKRVIPIIAGSFFGAGWTGPWGTDNISQFGFAFGNGTTPNTGVHGHSADWSASAEL